MNYKNYINNISGFQFIRVFRFLIILIIGITFSNFYTQKQVGEYELILFLASAISFFWLSGLTQGFLSLANTKNNKDKDSVIFNAFLLIFIFNILILIFLQIFKSSLSELLLNNKEIPYFKLFLLYTFFNNPSFLIDYIYIIKNKAGKLIIYGLISYLAQLLLVGMPPLVGLDLIYSLYGLIIISTLRFIWLIILIIKYSRITISFPFLKKYISTSTPLIFSILISGSAQYIDGLIISSYYKDESFFAVFRYGARELPLLLLADAFSNAMIPEISNNNINVSLKKIKRKSLNIMHIVFPVTILLLLTSHWFYPAIFTDAFKDSAIIFNTYLLLTITRLVFPQTILIGKRKNFPVLFSALTEFVINLVLSLILIQYLGLVGVAIATFFAYLTDKLILIFFNMRDKIMPSSYIPISWLGFYSLIILMLYLITDWNLFNISIQ